MPADEDGPTRARRGGVPDPGRTPSASTAVTAVHLARAKKEYEASGRRSSLLGPRMSGEPAWNILLDLFISGAANRTLSVSAVLHRRKIDRSDGTTLPLPAAGGGAGRTLAGHLGRRTVPCPIDEQGLVEDARLPSVRVRRGRRRGSHGYGLTSTLRRDEAPSRKILWAGAAPPRRPSRRSTRANLIIASMPEDESSRISGSRRHSSHARDRAGRSTSR
jgi:hypothetical protein